MFRQPTVGNVELTGLDEGGKVLWAVRHPNTLVYDGVDLLAQMLAWEPVRINAAYLEFVASGGSPGGVVDPAEGREYYQAIDDGVGPGSDYLRVPIVTPPHTESSDVEKFVGNRVVFSAFSAGDSGVNGTAFAEGASIFGLALVYAPDMADRTKDVVFARSYGFDPRVKAGTHQIMLRWAHTLGAATDDGLE
jgi:hypothetical protein